MDGRARFPGNHPPPCPGGRTGPSPWHRPDSPGIIAPRTPDDSSGIDPPRVTPAATHHRPGASAIPRESPRTDSPGIARRDPSTRGVGDSPGITPALPRRSHRAIDPASPRRPRAIPRESARSGHRRPHRAIGPAPADSPGITPDRFPGNRRYTIDPGAAIPRESPRTDSPGITPRLDPLRMTPAAAHHRPGASAIPRESPPALPRRSHRTINPASTRFSANHRPTDLG